MTFITHILCGGGVYKWGSMCFKSQVNIRASYENVCTRSFVILEEVYCLCKMGCIKRPSWDVALDFDVKTTGVLRFSGS